MKNKKPGSLNGIIKKLDNNELKNISGGFIYIKLGISPVSTGRQTPATSFGSRNPRTAS